MNIKNKNKLSTFLAQNLGNALMDFDVQNGEEQVDIHLNAISILVANMLYKSLQPESYYIVDKVLENLISCVKQHFYQLTNIHTGISSKYKGH